MSKGDIPLNDKRLDEMKSIFEDFNREIFIFILYFSINLSK